LTILRFQIEELKEPIQQFSSDVILIGEKEGGNTRLNRLFIIINIEKITRICNENFRKNIEISNYQKGEIYFKTDVLM
jgi:hypothetical protein